MVVLDEVVERNVTSRTYRIVYRVPPMGENGMRKVGWGNDRPDWVTEATVLDAYDAHEAIVRLKYRLSIEGCSEERMVGGSMNPRIERGPVLCEVLDIGPT